MKLLLDENLPHQLRHELPGHDCFTVTYMGWSGIRNGALLSRAAAAGFDAFLTKDTKLPYEQNLASLTIAVVILEAPTNHIQVIRPLIPTLLALLVSLPPRQVTHVR
jgi:putative NIF3 family GTP cyclohydrolase 1 type 2